MSQTDMGLWYGTLGSAPLPPLYVQQAGFASRAASTSPIAVANNTTINNILIGFFHVFLGSGGSNGTITASDSQSNSWTTDVQPASSAHPSLALQVAVCRVKLTTALTTSDTISFTLGGGIGAGAGVYGAQVFEFSGVLFAASPFDTFAADAAPSSSTTIATGATATLAQAKELVVSGASRGGTPSATVWTVPTAPYIEIPMGITNNICDAVYQQVSANTAQNLTFSQPTVPQNMTAAIATYKLL